MGGELDGNCRSILLDRKRLSVHNLSRNSNMDRIYSESHVSFKRGLFLCMLFAISVIVMVCIGLFYLYLVNPSNYLDIMRKLKVIDYIESSEIGINDVYQTLDVAPNTKHVIFQEKAGEYYISVLASIDKSFQTLRKSTDSQNISRFQFRLPVKLATGQEAEIFVDSYTSSIYFDQGDIEKDEDAFMSRHYHLKDGIQGYYFVNEGYLYLQAGDSLNIVWKIKDVPSKVIGRGGKIKKSLLKQPVFAIFVER